MVSDNARPNSVQHAALCLWLSAGLGLLMTTAQVSGLVKTVGAAGPGLTAAIGLVTAGLLALIAAKISAGRGWARWLFAAIYVIGSLGSVVLIFVALEVFRALPTILQANTIAQFVLQTAALVLVFTSTSRRWFNSTHADAAP